MSRLTNDITRQVEKKTERRRTPKKDPRPFKDFGSLDHIIAVLDLLNADHGYDDVDRSTMTTGEPLDGLILTLLSQNTNDRNRDMAYDKLRAHCPTWADVAALSALEIEDLIRSAGLAPMKSVRMKELLDSVERDLGEFSLKTMSSWDPAKVKEYLLSMNGIGPKTVACVMLFDFSMPAFPVDTHVARIARRLGWTAEKDTAEKIQDHLEAIVPHDRCFGGHLNMITHGRKICSARSPKCAGCSAASMCKTCIEAS